MSIQKNVAGQRLHFLMVDSADFATPEAGINTTNQYCKDNGTWSTCSNAESEINSGLYRITLAATETNAAVVTYKFTGAGCAKQFITVYPEAGYAAGISDLISNVSNVASSIDAEIVTTIGNKISSILVDTNATLQNQIASILVDTGTTLPATLSDINSGADLIFTRTGSILIDTGSTLLNRTTSIVDYASQVLSTVDAAVVTTIGNKITSILTDTNATLQNQVASILVDTGTTLPATLSDINSGADVIFTKVGSILIDTASTLSGTLSAILQDTGQISNLGVAGTSAILSTLDGPILSTLDGPIITTIGNKITSILTDTNATLQNQVASILVDTKQISNVATAADVVELIWADASAVIVENQLLSILADTGTTIPATLSDINSGADLIFTRVGSILIDTASTLSGTLSAILQDTGQISNLGAAGTSAVLSTLDGPITAYLSDLNSGLDVAANKVTSILADTGTTLENRTVSIVDQTSKLVSNVSNVASSIDAEVVTTIGNKITSLLVDTGTTLPATLSDINSGLDLNSSRLNSILVDTGTTLNNRQTSIVALVSDILSTVDDGVITTIGNKITSLLVDTGTTLPATLSDLNSGLDLAADKITSILADTTTTLDDKIDSILTDTGTTLPATLSGLNSGLDVAADKITSILTDTGTSLPAMAAIKKNTTLAKFAFAMTDATTHAPLAGLAPTCTRSIDGAAFGAGTLANIAEQVDAVGMYTVDFGAGDLNGTVIVLRATAAGADDLLLTLVTTP